jgi:mono/diheme cytochrome c family protein
MNFESGLCCKALPLSGCSHNRRFEMNNAAVRRGLVVLGLAMVSAASMAQQKTTDLGKLEFSENCAACHGVDGKGNGPLGNLLQKSPPDLTLLAKNNKGVMPINRMYEVIDGTGVASHGTRDMPVWGWTYQVDEGKNLREARGNYDAPAVVRARILTLLEYISRIQAP